jgi:hypothetical protein
MLPLDGTIVSASTCAQSSAEEKINSSEMTIRFIMTGCFKEKVFRHNGIKTQTMTGKCGIK